MIEFVTRTAKRLKIPPDFDGTKVLFDMYSSSRRPVVSETHGIQIESCNYTDEELVDYLRHIVDINDEVMSYEY